MALQEPWVERYRPTTLDGYVFTDNTQRQQIETWIKEQSFPTLMFSGPPGCGKTTLAKILIKACNVDPKDILIINGSRENSIDTIRDKVMDRINLRWGDFNVVLFDECDYLSKNAQAALRNTIEECFEGTRFIFTCNYINKVIPALRSRCKELSFNNLNMDEFTVRVITVLDNENITSDVEVIMPYLDLYYPDLRKCLNEMESNSVGGVLQPVNLHQTSTTGYEQQVTDLIKQKKYLEARQVLCASVRPNEIEDVYKWMYNHLELWGDTQDKKDEAILVIRNALANHIAFSDPEINLSACFIELSQIVRK